MNATPTSPADGVAGVLETMRRDAMDAALHRQLDADAPWAAQASEEAIRTVEALAATLEQPPHQHLRGKHLGGKVEGCLLCEAMAERDELRAKVAALGGAAPAKDGTPSSRWVANGEPDPHGKQYDCERAALAMGDYTDDELANAVFLHGNERPSIADMGAGKALPAIAYLTAAKDRIRWLSRRLAEATTPAAPKGGEELAETLDAIADDTRGHSLNGEQHDALRNSAELIRRLAGDQPATPAGGAYDRELIARMLESVAAGTVYGRDSVTEQIRLLREADNADASRIRTAPAGGGGGLDRVVAPTVYAPLLCDTRTDDGNDDRLACDELALQLVEATEERDHLRLLLFGSTPPAAWVARKPQGAPYWGIYTEGGETIAGTSSGLSERDAKLICTMRAAFCRLASTQAVGGGDGELLNRIDAVEYDESFDRHYIPVAPGWEIQTKGKGSTFRIAEPDDARLPIPDSPYLHETLTRMALAINAHVMTLQRRLRLASTGSAPAPSAWRPIESAPKDGTLVLTFAPLRTSFTRNIDINWFSDGAWRRSNYKCQPTHWIPLPAAPTQEPQG